MNERGIRRQEAQPIVMKDPRMKMKKNAFLLATGSLAMLALLPSMAYAENVKIVQIAPGAKGVIAKRIAILNSGSFFGVGVADIDEDRARTLGLKEEYGVEVKSVVPDSAAAKAGLKKGDVVLEFNGQRVE